MEEKFEICILKCTVYYRFEIILNFYNSSRIHAPFKFKTSINVYLMCYTIRTKE